MHLEPSYSETLFRSQKGELHITPFASVPLFFPSHNMCGLIWTEPQER
jgi:hypothetical protein